MSANSNWRSPESPGRGSEKRRVSRARPQVSAVAATAAPKRKMELVASVSRSSGLEKEGDALTSFDLQDEYREFIQGKLDDLWERHPRNSAETESEARQRLDAQENVLILFKKLREGIISSKRVGKFTLEVYETSLYLSVLFDSPRQISPVIPALVSYLQLSPMAPHPHRTQPILVCLLYHLVAGYPSQREFHAQFAALPKDFFPDDSPARVWMTSLAGCIRARNYTKLDRMTQLSALPVTEDPVDTPVATLSLSPESDLELGRKAFFHLVDSLRNKTREMAWTVMRAAYRELSCQADPRIDTRSWLGRSLGLLSSIPGGTNVDLDRWLERESGFGHIRKKDGVDGRWIVCKPR
ncbi:hypothetical protein B0H15DRAFT_857904 [Mycena belliarum]|uniref:Uncharacterized protein n=1 Tax=Mycena belliarum TaxID=1033014 RepID=A0AAD6XLL7_9AGAR|nr:hypothetical protein B0H15DRAFT_857904 [Mycena belliae]